MNVNAFLTKPISPATLLKLVNELLTGESLEESAPA